MTDISVIILVGREELHISRCLERLAPLAPRQIFIVESQKGDRTHEIAISTAHSLGWNVEEIEKVGRQWNQAGCAAEPLTGDEKTFANSNNPNNQTILSLLWHDWPGLQSSQFNWALDNLPLEGEWILRLDADEYLTEESIRWLASQVGEAMSSSFIKDSTTASSESSSIPSSVSALEFTLERKFCGGEIRHATSGIKMIRMFRRGRGRYADSAMDERLIIDPANLANQVRPILPTFPSVQPRTNVSDKLVHPQPILPTPVVFYDDNLNDMDWWREKHRGYAKREAQQALESMKTGIWTDPRKAKYYRFPPYLRALLYFAIRYILKGGILDGYAGWQWNFWQGLWYRWKCDQEITHHHP